MRPKRLTAARKMIGRDFGEDYVPSAPRKYQAKAKNAQEAHEAIRPTDVLRRPKDVARHLEPEQAKLYELIWSRTIACQMESAEMERTTVEILAEAGGRKLDFRATGQVIRFPGFLALYQEGRDDEDDEDSARLPPMQARDPLKKDRIETTQHFTEPPPRYTESALIKRMEELGIGRPSTYASTLAVLRDREYVRLEKKRLVPEDKGRLVTAFLEAFFAKYVEYDFTADLEERLDKVSNSEIDWKDLLRDFWRDFSGARSPTSRILRTGAGARQPQRAARPAHLPAARRRRRPATMPVLRGRPIVAEARQVRRLHRLLELSQLQLYARAVAERRGGGAGRARTRGRSRDGRHGDAAQRPLRRLRAARRGREAQAQFAAQGPRRRRRDAGEGARPAVAAARGGAPSRHRASRSSPGSGATASYVQHGKIYASLDKDDDVLEIGANRAIDLIVAKESGASSRFGSTAGRVLGDHPDGGVVCVKAGRFGPYVNHGKINATLPKGANPDGVDAGAGFGGAEGQGGRRRSRRPPARRASRGRRDQCAERPVRALCQMGQGQRDDPEVDVARDDLAAGRGRVDRRARGPAGEACAQGGRAEKGRGRQAAPRRKDAAPLSVFVRTFVPWWRTFSPPRHKALTRTRRLRDR